MPASKVDVYHLLHLLSVWGRGWLLVWRSCLSINVKLPSTFPYLPLRASGANSTGSESVFAQKFAQARGNELSGFSTCESSTWKRKGQVSLEVTQHPAGLEPIHLRMDPLLKKSHKLTSVGQTNYIVYFQCQQSCGITVRTRLRVLNSNNRWIEGRPLCKFALPLGSRDGRCESWYDRWANARALAILIQPLCWCKAERQHNGCLLTMSLQRQLTVK